MFSNFLRRFAKFLGFYKQKKYLLMDQHKGLYRSEFEHENCGAGFICNLKGERTNQIIHDALEILVRLEHRGGTSSDGKTGDGAGILIDIPDVFL